MNISNQSCPDKQQFAAQIEHLRNLKPVAQTEVTINSDKNSYVVVDLGEVGRQTIKAFKDLKQR